MQQKGLVHLYVGDGKGKTTAAAGLALRALGSGLRVLFCQFLKGRRSGELEPLERLGAILLHAKESRKFVFQMDGAERAEAKESHRACWEKASALVLSGEVDLAVLDEVVDAVNCGMIETEWLLELIRSRPAGAELVLTGRNPAPEICALADYHTEFRCVRHPYDSGTAARRGIEY